MIQKSLVSMDWFKGKFQPESPIFNGKIYGFLCQSIDGCPSFSDAIMVLFKMEP
jgi:hypothetical protein